MSKFDAKLHVALSDGARILAAMAPRSDAAPAAETIRSGSRPALTAATHSTDHVIAALEPLNVYRPGGGVIEAKTLQAVCREMLTQPTFNARQVRQALKRAGAPRGSEFRGADRLLGQLRDMGVIRYNRSKPSPGWDVVKTGPRPTTAPDISETASQ